MCVCDMALRRSGKTQMSLRECVVYVLLVCYMALRRLGKTKKCSFEKCFVYLLPVCCMALRRSSKTKKRCPFEPWAVNSLRIRDMAGMRCVGWTTKPRQNSAIGKPDEAHLHIIDWPPIKRLAELKQLHCRSGWVALLMFHRCTFRKRTECWRYRPQLYVCLF